MIWETTTARALCAGVVQWPTGSFPSCTREFDSPHPLHLFDKQRTKRLLLQAPAATQNPPLMATSKSPT